MTNYQQEDLKKFRGLGLKSISFITCALESMGIVGDGEEWMRG
jgi:hypothetical protein